MQRLSPAVSSAGEVCDLRFVSHMLLPHVMLCTVCLVEGLRGWAATFHFWSSNSSNTVWAVLGTVLLYFPVIGGQVLKYSGSDVDVC